MLDGMGTISVENECIDAGKTDIDDYDVATFGSLSQLVKRHWLENIAELRQHPHAINQSFGFLPTLQVATKRYRFVAISSPSRFGYDTSSEKSQHRVVALTP